MKNTYKLKDNLWINFSVVNNNGFIELSGLKNEKKVNSLFSISIYTIKEAIEEFEKYLNK